MSPSRLIAALALSASMLTLTACGTDNPAAPRVVDTPPASAPVVGDSAPCAGARADRKHAYFGDLHTHTAYSLDAYIGGARLMPSDAYRFAKGEEVEVSGIRKPAPKVIRVSISEANSLPAGKGAASAKSKASLISASIAVSIS